MRESSGGERRIGDILTGSLKLAADRMGRLADRAERCRDPKERRRLLDEAGGVARSGDVLKRLADRLGGSGR